MKQSNNKKSRDVTAFLYERLSRDDNLEGESYSIGNQKEMLTRYVREKPPLSLSKTSRAWGATTLRSDV